MGMILYKKHWSLFMKETDIRLWGIQKINYIKMDYIIWQTSWLLGNANNVQNSSNVLHISAYKFVNYEI